MVVSGVLARALSVSHVDQYRDREGAALLGLATPLRSCRVAPTNSRVACTNLFVRGCAITIICAEHVERQITATFVKDILHRKQSRRMTRFTTGGS